MINSQLTTCLSAGILSSIGSIGLALLVLLAMITVHEFGHYIVGKIFNFKINEFAIGMGPAIYKKTQKNGEIFSIRMLPLGGFCAFEGEDENNNDERAFNNKKPWQRALVLVAGATMNFIAAILVFCISISCYGQMCMQAFEVVPLEPESSYSLQNEDIILNLNGKDIYLTTDLISALKGKNEGEIVSATVLRNGKQENIEIRLRATPSSESLEDYSNILKSLGIANLTAVSESESKVSSTLMQGDFILRLSSATPIFYSEKADGLTDCVVIENGENVLKYIDEQTYLAEQRAFTPQDFLDIVKTFNAGDNLFIYISRGADRVCLQYTLPENFNDIKATDDGIYSHFGIKLAIAGSRMYSANVKFGFIESLGRGVVYAFKNAGATLSSFWQLITGKLSLNAMGGPITTITVTSQYASLGFNYLLEIAGFIGVSLAIFNLLPIPALDGARVVFVLIEWIRKKPINRNIEGAIHAVGLVALLIFAVVIDLVKCI